MLKILQAWPQQYVNWELPGVQSGFRKCRGTREQIVNIHWIIEKVREFQKNIYFCFIDYAKALDCVDYNCRKFLKRWECQTTTLMAESEEKLKSLFMKVKEESEKAGLKLNT